MCSIITIYFYIIKVKEIYVTLPTGWGPSSDFFVGSLKSAHSVVNINTGKSLQQKTESNLLTDEKGLHNSGQVVVWTIHLIY